MELPISTDALQPIINAIANPAINKVIHSNAFFLLTPVKIDGTIAHRYVRLGARACLGTAQPNPQHR